MTSVLVTGATGFVGSHILEALRHAPVATIAACRDPSRLPAWFAGEIRPGDLRDNRYAERLPSGADVVCHAAGWSSLHGNRRNAQERFLAPTLRLLDAVGRQGAARFVFPSTHGAARPGEGRDARAPGRAPAFWPHLEAVVAIEDEMRRRASETLTMISLRLGAFVGRNYSLGLLPILLPRLKTHLVPWVAGGRTPMPLIAGEDVGQAFARAALEPTLKGYEAFNVFGSEIPTVREVIAFLHDEYGTPLPHFGVPFAIAYPFAWAMEALDPLVPWDPLITRSIIHLLRDFGGDNAEASARLGYRPAVDWRSAVRAQIEEMKVRQVQPMPMRHPLD